MKRISRKNAFTLIEIVISIAITTLIGLGVISSLVYSRTISELDKQRIVAINYARSYIEEFRRPFFPTLQGQHQVVLDDFNTPAPSDDLHATLNVDLYKVNADGSRGAKIVNPPMDQELLEIEVTVSWNRTGRLSSKQVTETLHSYIAPVLYR
jgi:type II secretory pathway pseudopilin PulG